MINSRTSLDIRDLEYDVSSTYRIKLGMLSGYVLLVYDYFLTISDEVEFILHHSRFNLGKLLFLMIRYFTIFSLTFIVAVMFTDNLSNEMCLVWIRFHLLAGAGEILLAEMTLQLRLYAIYERSRRILIFMVSTFAVTSASAVILVVDLMKRERASFFHPTQSKHVFGCIPRDVPSNYKYLWVPVFVQDSLLFALALGKGFLEMREARRQNLTAGQRRRECTYTKSLMMLLVRDSLLYFIVVFSVSFGSELVYVIVGGNYVELPVGLVMATTSIMCQRILLQMRKYVYNRSHSGSVSLPIVHVQSQSQGQSQSQSQSEDPSRCQSQLQLNSRSL